MPLPANSRNAVIQLRVTEKEKATWKEAADDRRISLSEYIRMHVNDASRNEPHLSTLDKDFIHELIKLVFQLRSVLASRFTGEFKELEQILERMEPEIDAWDL